MKKSIAIIGLSRFGLSLAESLNRLNVDIIGVDQNKENVRKASEIIRNVYVIDSTDIDALKSVGIANVDHAIVAIGQNDKSNLSSSVITISKLKQLGVEKITARADDEDYAEILRLVGSTDVISPLSIASERIANKIAAGNVVDYFNIKNDFDVYEVKIPNTFAQIAITELDSRTKYRINLLLIERNNKLLIPTKETILMPGDDIFIFGKKKDIPQITGFFSE